MKRIRSVIALLLVISLTTVWGGELTYAGVSDNVQTASVEQMIGSPDDSSESKTVFGMLKDILSKINTIITTLATQSTQLSELSTQMTNMDAKIQNVYVATASTSFSSSQVRSTVVESIAPSEVLVKWDCTKDNRCVANSEFPERIDDTVITGFNIYYSNKNAAVKNMVYVDTVPYNDGILYTEDYKFVINGLNPNTTYYIWVSANVGDAQNPVVLNDNSYVRVIKTLTLESAKVTNVSAQPDDIDTLSISWQQPLTSNTVSGYNVYYSEAELTKENISSCATYNNTSSCSVTVTGLDATIYYYIAVVPIMRDDSIGLNIAATDISRASLKLSQAGGRLIPADLDNDSVDEVMLVTLTYGSGQIKSNSDATLLSYVNQSFTNTSSPYYSKVMEKLINEDRLTFHALTAANIQTLKNSGKNYEFVGPTTNLFYSDTTKETYDKCYYASTIQFGWGGSQDYSCEGMGGGNWSASGSQTYYNTVTKTFGTNTWSGYLSRHRHSYYENGGGWSESGSLSMPTTSVSLAGYFLISDMQK